MAQRDMSMKMSNEIDGSAWSLSADDPCTRIYPMTSATKRVKASSRL